ncbi:hypothetical protein Hanom_Chr14g01271561 [Helianthus anomalus]
MDNIRLPQERLVKEKADFEAYKRTEAAATMENIRAAQERMAKEKGNFETYKRTEKWATREHWNEACACDNDKFYHLRQKIVNLKAANAGLEKRENAAVATMEEAIVARTTTVEAMRKPTLRETARKDLQAKDVALAEVTRRLIEAEVRAYAEGPRVTKVEEDHQRVLDQHAEAVAQLDDAKIVNAILDAPEVSVAVKAVRAKARDAGYKAGYTECLTHVNVVSERKFIDEQCPVREVDTKGELKAVSDAYDNLVVPTLGHVKECLAADDYVNRLRGLFEPKENVEGETKGEGQG